MPPCTTATLSLIAACGGELRVELHVRLRVVVDQLDLPAEQAAGGVDLLDGEVNASTIGLP